jgi:hypothetical protein
VALVDQPGLANMAGEDRRRQRSSRALSIPSSPGSRRDQKRRSIRFFGVDGVSSAFEYTTLSAPAK